MKIEFKNYQITIKDEKKEFDGKEFKNLVAGLIGLAKLIELKEPVKLTELANRIKQAKELEVKHPVELAKLINLKQVELAKLTEQIKQTGLTEFTAQDLRIETISITGCIFNNQQSFHDLWVAIKPIKTLTKLVLTNNKLIDQRGGEIIAALKADRSKIKLQVFEYQDNSFSKRILDTINAECKRLKITSLSDKINAECKHLKITSAEQSEQTNGAQFFKRPLNDQNHPIQESSKYLKTEEQEKKESIVNIENDIDLDSLDPDASFSEFVKVI